RVRLPVDRWAGRGSPAVPPQRSSCSAAALLLGGEPRGAGPRPGARHGRRHRVASRSQGLAPRGRRTGHGGAGRCLRPVEGRGRTDLVAVRSLDRGCGVHPRHRRGAGWSLVAPGPLGRASGHGPGRAVRRTLGMVIEVATKTRILVVDDDRTVADVVSRYLQREGFDVDVQTDGPAALERALASPPDLVVLDVMLPGMDGLEVFERIRASTPVPIIFLTARGAEEERIGGLELGADDYLAKPFSPRELTARVKSVLRGSRIPIAPSTEEAR